MTGGPDRAERRVRRLLRCYPPAWRVRYGEEFIQLLVDDFAERPRSPRRTTDVVLSAGLARLARAGLTGDVLEPQGQMRAGLALLAGALSAFLILGIAIWSQLTIGWQWSAPQFAGHEDRDAADVRRRRCLRGAGSRPGVMRYESRVGVATACAMAVALAEASSWVITGGPSPRGLFRVGAIDAAGVAAMFVALMLGFHALRRGLTADAPGAA